MTISKFGALNCALIGLARKMLSLLLSFILYGHTLNAFQTVGLTLSLAAMIANFYEKGGKKHKGGHEVADQKEAPSHENAPLLSDVKDHDEESNASDMSPTTNNDERLQEIELTHTLAKAVEHPSEVDLMNLDEPAVTTSTKV